MIEAYYDINYSDNPVVNENFSAEVNSMNENAYRNMDVLDFEFNSIFSKFFDTAFKIGSSDAFQILATEYEDTVNLVIKRINEYVECAKNAKIAIETAIDKDKKAHQLADNAKKIVLDNYPTYEVVLNSKNTTPALYPISQYEADKKLAGDNEYNNVWKINCWKYEK